VASTVDRRSLDECALVERVPWTRENEGRPKTRDGCREKRKNDANAMRERDGFGTVCLFRHTSDDVDRDAPRVRSIARANGNE